MTSSVILIWPIPYGMAALERSNYTPHVVPLDGAGEILEPAPGHHSFQKFVLVASIHDIEWCFGPDHCAAEIQRGKVHAHQDDAVASLNRAIEMLEALYLDQLPEIFSVSKPYCGRLDQADAAGSKDLLDQGITLRARPFGKTKLKVDFHDMSTVAGKKVTQSTQGSAAEHPPRLG